MYAQLLQKVIFIDFHEALTTSHSVVFYVKLPQGAVVFEDILGRHPAYFLRSLVPSIGSTDFTTGPSFLHGNQNMTPFLFTRDCGTDQSMIDRAGLVATITKMAHEAGEPWIQMQMLGHLFPGAYVMNPDIVRFVDPGSQS